MQQKRTLNMPEPGLVSRIATRWGLLLLLGAGVTHGATVYTNDSNLSDFTNNITNYATFIQGDRGQAVPFTPTAASLASGLDVYSEGTEPPVVVQFSSPVSAILVFPDIDNFGSAYDGYQYTISGSNDGVTYTPLFNVLSVNGVGEPFTIGSFTGTAPLSVNNVLTPGSGSQGVIGYEAAFSFSQAYRFYSFGASSIATADGNQDRELGAVAAIPANGAPEPDSFSLLVMGVAAIYIGRSYRCRAQ